MTRRRPLSPPSVDFWIHRLRARLRVEQLEDRTVPSAAGLPSVVDFSQLQIDTGKYAADEILVYQTNPGAAKASIENLGLGTVQDLGLGVVQVSLASDVSVSDAMNVLQGQGFSAEPNYQITLDVTFPPGTPPGDPDFDKLWGLHNTGQSGGTADADIDAPEGWELATDASSVIVAVIDTGVDYNHPQLAANIWTNNAEADGAAGVDDDGNGFVDDIHGYDFVNNDGDPMDDHGHGTHVSGTIGAVGTDGSGIAGVSWNVQIMGLKFLNASGSGDTSDAIVALQYAVDNGAVISNNSWGGGGFSQAMYSAIEAAQGDANSPGHIFVAAAGNGGFDGFGDNNDNSPHYPSNYNLDNVVAVAATDHHDNKASFSNYGANTVDLGAPGVNIYSTLPNNSYAYFSGTSMATPHVAGAIALFRALAPDARFTDVTAALAASVDPIASLAGITKWGGRLNLRSFLEQANQPPVATNNSFSVTEDNSLAIGIASQLMHDDYDPDGPAPQFQSFSQAANGAVVHNTTDGTLIYTPDTDFSGNDTFTYTIVDDNGATGTGTVTITVDPVNDAPVASDDAYGLNIQGGNNSLTVNAANGVLANDEDVDGDTLQAVKLTDPSQGTVVLNEDGSFTYTLSGTPTERSDSFTYMVNDGTVDGNAATVSIHINHFPVAGDDNAVTDEDEAVNIAVLGNDSDGDGDTLTITSIGNASNGSVADNGDGTITYTPDADFNGTDSFTYTIDDGFGGSDSATVDVTVNAVNDAPVAIDDNAITNQDTAVNIAVLTNDADIDGDTLSIESFTDGNDGTVTQTGDTLTYTPDAGFTGTDSFTYTITDGNGEEDTATVAVTVQPPLIVVNGSFEDGLNGWTTIGDVSTVGGNFDEDPVDGVQQGLLTTNDAAGGGSYDVFSIEGFLGVDTGALFNLIPGVPIAGSALKQAIEVQAGESLEFSWAFLTDESTPDSIYNDMAAFTFVGPSGQQQFDLLASTVTAPAPGFGSSGPNYSSSTGYHTQSLTADESGVWIFGVAVLDATDTQIDSALALDAVGGAGTPPPPPPPPPTNNPPNAVDDAANTSENVSVNVNVLANDNDPDGDPLAVVSFTQPLNGFVSDNGGGSLNYAPNFGFNGADSFTYTISDGRGGSDSATVTVTVNASSNQPPLAVDDSASVHAGNVAFIDVLANDSDPDGDFLQITDVTQGSLGAVWSDGYNLSYSTYPGLSGTDTFTYTITDGNGGSDSATVTVTVTNGAPIAVDDSASVHAGNVVFIDVMANDSDPDGDFLQITDVTQGSLGAVWSDGYSLSYSTYPGLSGTDTFTYTIADGNGGSDSATVTVTVTNGAPIAVDDSASVHAGNVVFIDVMANDSDPDGDFLQISNVTQGSLGAVWSDGYSLSYSTYPGLSGTDTFTYTIADGNGGSDSATVTVDISGGADITTDLVAHWTFDANVNGTVADTAPFGVKNDKGTLAGNAFVSGASRIGSGALDVDGNDRVDVANSGDINTGFHSQRTISFWINARNEDGNRRVIYEEGGGSRGANIYTVGGGASGYVTLYVGAWNKPETGWKGTFLSTTVPTNSWHHVAFVLNGDSGNMTGYVNGQSFATGFGGALYNHGGDINIGGIQGKTIFENLKSANGSGFDGLIDDGMIYNRALSAADIQELYQSGGAAAGASFFGFANVGGQVSQSVSAENTAPVFTPIVDDPVLLNTLALSGVNEFEANSWSDNLSYANSDALATAPYSPPLPTDALFAADEEFDIGWESGDVVAPSEDSLELFSKTADQLFEDFGGGEFE